MDLMDILKPYVDRPTDASEDFDEVARSLPRQTLGEGIAEAFRSDRTPDFGDMAASLFGASNPQQRSGLLGQLMATIGPAVLASVAGGVLGRFGQHTSAEGGAAVAEAPPSADELDRLEPSQVRELAIAAQQQDPGVMDRIAAFYARHPEAVKALGGTALAIALAQIGKHLRR